MTHRIRPPRTRACLIASLALGLAACATQPPLSTHPTRPDIPSGLDLYLPTPEDNPLTPARVDLGRRLFFDPVLSRDRTLACASCHDPARAFTDGRPVSVGVFGRTGRRNVPTLVNRAYGRTHFWDGRIVGLEAQVLQPIVHPDELGMTVDDALLRLRSDRFYPRRFRAAFGRDMSEADLARALAAYVRTILAGDAPIDRYLAGDTGALSEQERRGLKLFRGRANCTACHAGPTLTDEQFHNTGVAWRDGAWQDPGRFAVTGREEDRGSFKTPTLREAAHTAPYMHDGSLATLEAVIDFYDQGGRPNPNLDSEIRPLHLTDEEKEALVAFLRALSGEIREGLAGGVER